MNNKKFSLIFVFFVLSGIFLLIYKIQDYELGTRSSSPSINVLKVIEKSKNKDLILNTPKSISEIKISKINPENEINNNPPTKPIQGFDIKISFEDQNYYSTFLKFYQKGDYKNALIYGKNLLKIPDKYSKNYWYGNVIHTTNIVLGKIYLALGDLGASESYLLNSVNTKYISKTQDEMFSPQLASFGPDISLAYDLYKAGRRESVTKYFQGLKSFWKIGLENGFIENSLKNIKNGVKDEENYPNQITGFPFEKGYFAIPNSEGETVD
jgi:hypothetical protein